MERFCKYYMIGSSDSCGSLEEHVNNSAKKKGSWKKKETITVLGVLVVAKPKGI